MPIFVGKWLLILLLTLNGHILVANDKGTLGEDVNLSPSNGWITDVRAVEYGTDVYGIYNIASVESPQWSSLYIFALGNEVAWYAPFWPAAEQYQLFDPTIYVTSDNNLQICGSTWQMVRHCWIGVPSETDPWFASWEHIELGVKLYLPDTIK